MQLTVNDIKFRDNPSEHFTEKNIQQLFVSLL